MTAVQLEPWLRTLITAIINNNNNNNSNNNNNNKGALYLTI
jgi:hypothetical protein